MAQIRIDFAIGGTRITIYLHPQLLKADIFYGNGKRVNDSDVKITPQQIVGLFLPSDQSPETETEPERRSRIVRQTGEWRDAGSICIRCKKSKPDDRRASPYECCQECVDTESRLWAPKPPKPPEPKEPAST